MDRKVQKACCVPQRDYKRGRVAWRLFFISCHTQPLSTMVLLVTSDNEQFHADKEVVERSVLIKNMLEGKVSFMPLCSALQLFPMAIDVGESDQPIPLPNVSSSVLKKVIVTMINQSFMRRHSALADHPAD